MNFNNLDWSLIMDWVVFTTCAVLLITVIFDILKSIKGRKSSSDEHAVLKDNQKEGQFRLENQHNHIEAIIQNEHQQTNHIIEKETTQIYNVVNNVDKILAGEIERNKIYQSNLNENQLDIKQSVKAIDKLMKEVEKLQTLTVLQKRKILELEQENMLLKKELTESNEQKHNQSKRFTQNM